MRKVWHLSTCSTCKRILGELALSRDNADGIELQDIKKQNVDEAQLAELARLAGSYEALFTRRSRQYKARGLAGQALGEDDYRALILEEYSFLKRPVVQLDGQVFIGNSKKNVEALGLALAGLRSGA